jgi:hypothetical protein
VKKETYKTWKTKHRDTERKKTRKKKKRQQLLRGLAKLEDRSIKKLPF